MAAIAQVSVRPATEKPSGTRPTTSRWLIQTCWRPARPANSGSAASSSSSVARPYSPLIALADLAAQQVRHELLAVADAEHRHAEREDGGIHRGAARGRRRWTGSAGDDDALGSGEFGGRRLAGADLGIDAEVADLAGDQMAILAPGVEDDDLSCRVQLPMVASCSVRGFYGARSTSTAFRPPNAKELEIAYSTCCRRATFGITSRSHSGSGSLKLAVGGRMPSRSASDGGQAFERGRGAERVAVHRSWWN